MDYSHFHYEFIYEAGTKDWKFKCQRLIIVIISIRIWHQHLYVCVFSNKVDSNVIEKSIYQNDCCYNFQHKIFKMILRNERTNFISKATI